jgi:hypothetical protein
MPPALAFVLQFFKRPHPDRTPQSAWDRRNASSLLATSGSSRDSRQRISFLDSPWGACTVWRI